MSDKEYEIDVISNEEDYEEVNDEEVNDEDNTDDNEENTDDNDEENIDDNDEDNYENNERNNDGSNDEDNNENIDEVIEDGDEDIDGNDFQTYSNTQNFKAKKRAHHNALERKRRDNIKSCFSNLKNALPTLRRRKGASRTQVLDAAISYGQTMPGVIQQDMQRLKNKKQDCLSIIAKLRMLREAMRRGDFFNEELLNMDSPFVEEEIDLDESDPESSLSDLTDKEMEIQNI